MEINHSYILGQGELAQTAEPIWFCWQNQIWGAILFSIGIGLTVAFETAQSQFCMGQIGRMTQLY
jgi:hypothetical protein